MKPRLGVPPLWRVRGGRYNNVSAASRIIYRHCVCVGSLDDDRGFRLVRRCL